jgi:hypothetical protein
MSHNVNFCDGGTINIYASKIHHRDTGKVKFNTGSCDIRNSILSFTGTAWNQAYKMAAGMFSVVLKKVYYNKVHEGDFSVGGGRGSYEDIHVHDSAYGVGGHHDSTFSGVKVSTFSIGDAHIQTADVRTVNIVDAVPVLTTPVIATQETSVINPQYTINIHVADKDGANLASVTVLCEDESGTQVFSVSTDANGDIAEQTVTWKKWVGTSETETGYSPHKFTLSKAGYETLPKENITVDGSIKWHLELQDVPEQKHAISG